MSQGATGSSEPPGVTFPAAADGQPEATVSVGRALVVADALRRVDRAGALGAGAGDELAQWLPGAFPPARGSRA